MLNQLSTRQWPLPGYPGDFPFFGPMVVKPVILKTSNAALNVPGVALTFQNGSTTNAIAGGSGVFAGILSNKNTQPYDGNLPTGPVLNIPNDTPTFATSLITGVYATLSTTARVGDGVAFNTSTGVLAAAPGGVVPNGHTLIAGAVIFRRNVDAAGTAGIVMLGDAGTAAVIPPVVPTILYTDASIVPGTSTANGFMAQVTTKDANRVQTIIRNQTPFTLVTAEQTSDNLTVTQPSVGSYIDLPPNSQNRIEGNASKMWVGVKATALASVTSVGTLCTIVFVQPHGMTTGGILTLIDFVPTGYNGQLYTVTVVDANTLTVTLAASAGVVTTIGKVFPRPITGVTVQTTTTP